MDDSDGQLHTRAKGRAGEDVAVEYLTGIGYTIVERNFQTRAGEIDCIARDKSGVLVFVEVKTSWGPSFVHPFHKINYQKQRTIATMARIYRARYRVSGPCRFDAIAIVGNKIEHLRNAFLV